MVVMAEKTRQYYKMTKKFREHEIEMASMRIFEKMCGDPEFKYYLGFMGGIAGASLSGVLKKMTTGSSSEDIYDPGGFPVPQPKDPGVNASDENKTQYAKDMAEWTAARDSYNRNNNDPLSGIAKTYMGAFAGAVGGGLPGILLSQNIASTLTQSKQQAADGNPAAAVLGLFEIGAMSFSAYCGVILFLKALNPEGSGGGGILGKLI
jgi:hypothetical protein